MQISDFQQFVRESDQSISMLENDREDVYLYGLASEIGALVAAIKRKLRWDERSTQWNVPNDAIRLELGDALWYCFALADLRVPNGPAGLFELDVQNLRKSLQADDQRTRSIHQALDTNQRLKFLVDSEQFIVAAESDIDSYQSLAFLTARTKEEDLLEVCLAVLWQLAAELLRRKLPDLERTINQTMPDRPLPDVVGEVMWHLSAVASLYGLTLSSAAQGNMLKVAYRKGRGHVTPLHDEAFPNEQFERQFQISFVRVAPGRSRMYLHGRQLGDDLTDNAYDDDGYRFHDVLHLANIAKLGWSPVFRALLSKKRKSDKKIDEVEDGARAQIAEEAVVKLIHSEGLRLARERHPEFSPQNLPLYSDKSYINHGLLTAIRDQIIGLEVQENKYWEWVDCILEGYAVFNALRREQQGTVFLDLNERLITFEKDVELDVAGVSSGIGSAQLEIFSDASEAKRILFK
ncbi:hypothetical protein [Sphingosinicella sp.]|uniref:hypothetical protein n=1 Tax=Sphingosinicella sp. TaxID=1917971 RepID=UPI0040376054